MGCKSRPGRIGKASTTLSPAMGAGGIAVTNPLEGTWVNNPFKQGDVLIFHSMVVHKGVSNSSDRLRMSMDARYQKVSDPIAPGSLLPHAQPATWEEIYADSDWDRDDLKVLLGKVGYGGQGVR